MIDYIYGGMFVLSLVLIYFAIKQYEISKELLNDGIQTTGKVIDLIEIRDSDGTTYKPVFKFTDRTGEEITFKSAVSSSPTPYKIGDKVNIIYSKHNEQRKVISFWGLYRWTIICLSFAAPLLIIGAGYLLYSKN